MLTYQIEYSNTNMPRAISQAFSYLESMDEIVGTVCVTPAMAKRIILSMPNDVTFDYIPEGIGILRTAYLKFMPSVKDNEIRFYNQDNTVELKLFLI